VADCWGRGGRVTLLCIAGGGGVRRVTLLCIAGGKKIGGTLLYISRSGERKVTMLYTGVRGGGSLCCE